MPETTTKPTCRVCGCTDDNCETCIAKTGKPCSWVEPDLCSACAPDVYFTKPEAKRKAAAGQKRALDEVTGKATPPTFALLPLTCLEPSPTNPRTIFATAPLEELAESIRKHGVLSPLTVRPYTSKRKATTHQICLGERRWRASAEADLELVPVLVVDWDDDHVAECQLIENAQREDLHPLEESDTYASLLKRPGWTEDRVADRTNVTLAHVKARLRLQGLTPASRELFHAGKFGLEVAQLLVRQALPADLHDKAAAELAEGDETHVHNDSGQWLDETRPLTVREAEQLLREKYMTRLDRAPFPADDAELVPAAGACTTCPKRTGNQPELFADVTKADTCTDPSCFTAKIAAHTERRLKEAKAAKLTVLPVADAKKVFGGNVNHQTGNTNTTYGGKLAATDERLPYEVTKDYQSEKTWGDLAKELPKPPSPIIAKDPNTGTVRELVDKNKLLAEARKAGTLKPERKKASSASSSGKSPAQAARERKERLEEAATLSLLTAVAAAEPSAKAETAWWRWMVGLLVVGSDYSGPERVADRRDLKGNGGPQKQIVAAADRMKTSKELRGLAQELAVATMLAVTLGDEDECEPLLAEGCKVLGIDRGKLLEAVTKTFEAEQTIDGKKKAAKTAKKGGRRG